jgi:mono/diheme cytochrome c family protein
VRPTRAVNRGYQAGILRDDGSLAAYTAVCSPTVYRGDRLPAELRGNVFVAEPAGNVVSRLILSDDGTKLVARKAYEKGEFLASTDERFRPVYLSSAPDGTLYVVDLYHGIIQHKGFITEYLRDQYLSRKLEQDIHHGRIWRIVHDSTTRGPKPALSKATLPQLVTTLSHPNGWWRDTAQRLLVERGAKPVAAQLTQLAASAPEPRTRLHALWTLDGDDLTTPSIVLAGLRDGSRDVRVSAIRVAERFMADNAEVQAAMNRLMDDPDWNVQQQLAASIGALPDGARETAVATLLAKQGDDPVVVDAALSGVSGREAAVLTELLKTSVQSAPREQAITMVAATVVRASQDAAVQALLAWVADESHPGWARSAVLRGAEVALTGAAIPGSPAGRRGAGIGNAANAPCPTCPGGRAGPGGASAFGGSRGGDTFGEGAGGGPPGVRAAGGRGAGGRGGGGRPVRLNREPAPFTALAASGGDLGTRAAALLGRIEWPGKPGVAAAVAPLTPEEQRRFDAGRELYLSLCAACHQPDGRGREKLGANLVGATLALAPAHVTARIVIGGKEGPIGLMPPLGASLTDDQIANALTYVRREWGNTGTPVDAQTVKAAREASTGRTRPWTTEELTALIGGGR